LLPFLVEEAQDLATGVALDGLLVVHNTEGRRQDNEAELTGWEDGPDPLLEAVDWDIVTGADGTALVQAAVEVDDDLLLAAVINNFEVANVAVALHHAEELHDDLGRGADEHLALATALGTCDGAQGGSQNGHAGHLLLFMSMTTDNKVTFLSPIIAKGWYRLTISET